MYEIDGICYAGTPNMPIEEILVVDAVPLNGGMLLVTFSTGEKKLFDTTSLKGSAFEPLQNESVFQASTVEHGFVSWLNGEIDIAPKYMYENGWKYNQFDIVQARPSV